MDIPSVSFRWARQDQIHGCGAQDLGGLDHGSREAYTGKWRIFYFG